MQTVLVSGGSGFIGSHLCKNLLKKQFKIICIDNLITGDKKNIEPFLKDQNFTFIEHDITESISNFQYPISNIQYIFHLASPASPSQKSKKSYINYPIETLLANAAGTKNLLELARGYNAKFLFASSSEVYGDPLVSPQKEDYFGNVNPIGIRSVYDEGKRFGEAMTMAYLRKFNVDARIVRIFNTYGPHMQKDDGRVVSNFIMQSLAGNPITVYGDGQQTRSLCFISDMVDAIERAMFKDKTNAEVINLGNPDERKIVELGKLIKDLTGSRSEIVSEELPSDDPKKRKPDISKARKLLGWEPKVLLEDGLKMTIDYFRKT